jgi:hypothetical protein
MDPVMAGDCNGNFGPWKEFLGRGGRIATRGCLLESPLYAGEHTSLPVSFSHGLLDWVSLDSQGDLRICLKSRLHIVGRAPASRIHATEVHNTSCG